MNGVLRIGTRWELTIPGESPHFGFLFSVNRLYRIGGKKMAHISVQFPTFVQGFREGLPLKLPLLVPYHEIFDKFPLDEP